jgi:hypothetical protein
MLSTHLLRGWLLSKLIPKDEKGEFIFSANVPLYLRTFILTIALVWIVFIGMPLLEKIFEKYLP